MKSIYRYLIGILGIIIVIFILNFIFSIKKINPTRYVVIEKQNPEIKKLFRDSTQVYLEFETAFGNENEQIYIYSFKNSYKLIVWNITGFSDITPSNINIFSNDQFDQIIFNPQTFVEWGSPAIKMLSKADSLNAKNLIVHVNEGYKLNRYKKESDLLFFDIESKGLALSDTSIAYSLKIEFENSLNYNVCFLNRGTNFQIIILMPNLNEILLNEDLLKLL